MNTNKHVPSAVTGELTEDVHCLLLDSRGIYIPRDFARYTKRECISGVKTEDLDYLARGPGGVRDEDTNPIEGETKRGEWYWDTWQDVLDSAIVTCPVSGRRFKLHQDGDLFLVPESWEWCDSTHSFRPPESDALMRFVLPAHWASYIANGDDSGISSEDKDLCDDWLAENVPDWTFADVGERYFANTNDAGTLAGDVAEYTFVKIVSSDK